MIYPMLAKVFKGTDQENVIVQQKIDGNRAILRKDQRGVILYSRNLNLITGVDHILEDAKLLEDGYYDGELIVPSSSRMEGFKQTQSLVRRKNTQKPELQLLIFDMIESGSFLDRYLNIQNINLPNIKSVPILILPTNELDDYFNKIPKEWEGIMIRLGECLYQEGKRSSELLKLKKKHSIDLLVVDQIEGKGKHTGRMGALICDYNGNTVKVGAGFSDEERTFDFLGKLIEVEYDSKTNQSLRFPIYKCLK